MPYKSLSDVTDASNGRGMKRFTLFADVGVTQAAIEAPGFFSKYELRGWYSGDMIDIIAESRRLVYIIINDSGPDDSLTIMPIPISYGTDDQIASEVPTVPGPAGTVTAGLLSTQAQLDALNAYLAAIAAAQVSAVPGGAGTPTAGAITAQAQLDALNVYLDTLGAINVAAVAGPALTPTAGITTVQGQLAALNAAAAAATDDQTAAEVPTAAPAIGPGVGQTSAQAYLNALNAYLAALTSSQVANVGGVAGTPTAGTLNVQAAVDALNGAAAANATMSGRPLASVDMGTFTGTTIPDNVTMVAALQALETAVELAIAGTGPNFAASNTDTLVNITPGGAAGHTPAINLNAANLITMLLASPAFVTGINAIISNRFTFDGTTLCFDFNNNGSTMS